MAEEGHQGPSAKSASPELLPEQQAAVLAWLEKRWEQPKTCPVCGRAAWDVQRQLGAILVSAPGGGLQLDQSFPCVVAVCRNCAFMLLFNAVRMGIVAKATEGRKEKDNA